jgi:hypothetical protein
MVSHQYRAQPLRRIYIPKENGSERPISLPALEDKIVQKATVTLLNAIYEQDFLPCSYGFRPGRSPHDALAAVSFVAVVALGAAIWMRPPARDATAYRTEISMPVGFEAGGPPGRFAVSPDGRHLAFSARDQTGKILLWVRAFDEPNPRPLAGTDGALHPFWSPDSRTIAFYAGGKLKKISATGGASFTICDAGLFAQGGTWNRDDVIVFNLGAGPLFRVSANGGTPRQGTALDQKARETGHAFPFFLPDGRHFLYTVYSTDRTVADTHI